MLIGMHHFKLEDRNRLAPAAGGLVRCCVLLRLQSGSYRTLGQWSLQHFSALARVSSSFLPAGCIAVVLFAFS